MIKEAVLSKINLWSAKKKIAIQIMTAGQTSLVKILWAHSFEYIPKLKFIIDRFRLLVIFVWQVEEY